MGALTNYTEQALLNHLVNQVSFTTPQTYLALFTSAPNDSGGGTEVSGGGYSRQRVYESGSTNTPRWSNATSESAGSGSPSYGFFVSNANDIVFPQATSNWGEVVAWALFDAATAGNMLVWGWLSRTSSPFTVDAQGAIDDRLVSPNHGLANGDRVVLRGSSLPVGLSEDTPYYVVNAGTHSFQVSTTQGGPPVDITSVGYGEVLKLEPKLISANDQIRILAGDLKIILR